ncbi:MAG: hypothetical protein Q9191_000267 [Dirinaria sp. TL-2023a]
MDKLVDAIQSTPIIDHHAHNILLPPEQQRHPLLSVTSEATGDALQYTSSTLAHIRAVQQLSEILQCESAWQTVQEQLEQRRKAPDDTWAKECFCGIETVLIDDGLDADSVHPYHWHNRLTRSKCMRIVRIEKVAEHLINATIENRARLSSQDRDNNRRSSAKSVVENFLSEVNKAISDPEVAGFKSVVCYRSGLAIPEFNRARSEEKLVTTLAEWSAFDKAFRLEEEQLCSFFVHLTAQSIGRSKLKKPFQFHTGLGDNDIRLPVSSPAHLQLFIETYSAVPIVLLHASYPFTREAGYLASVYANVYLDIGEVFPMVSQEGQEKVLCEYVASLALPAASAIKIVQDLLFNTSNQLYDLRLSLTPFETTQTLQKLVSGGMPPTSAIQKISILRQFLIRYPFLKYLRLQWVDYTATVRARVLPIKNALEMFDHGKCVSVTKAVLGLIQTDAMTDCHRATGQYDLYPNFESLRIGPRAGYAMVQCGINDGLETPAPACPRSSLRTIVERANDQGISFLVGFEIEVVFMSSMEYSTLPSSQGQAWSSARALENYSVMDVVESAMDQLERSGIGIQQFHAESGAGQFEFVMDPLDPLAAVDSLICAREIIGSEASKHSMRATFVPKASAAGTGAHVHVSMLPSEPHRAFLAGVLKQLSAILAITLPNVTSYDRVADSEWSGGTWVTWGTQNREAPIRYISGSRYEFKCVDGLANPYLALAAILGAGLQGVLSSEPLIHKDCLDDPANLTSDQRRSLGITLQVPRSIDEALTCFKKSSLRAILGDAVFENYLAVKETEIKMLQPMEPDSRRKWLIDRY